MSEDDEGRAPLNMRPETGGRGVRIALAVVAAAAVVVAVVVAVGIGSTRNGSQEEPLVVAALADRGPAAVADGSTGTIRVQLEPVDGVFVEGFEVGLRFETPAGELIASTLWSDFIESTGRFATGGYYDSVLEQSVPAGTVKVRAEVSIGPAGPPSIPDLTGDLPCELDVTIESAHAVTIEVLFDGTDTCLRRVPAISESPVRESSTSLPTTTSSPESTTTSSSDPAPSSEPLAVGTTHYVDVDLRCQAFELAGLWVLLDGDPSTWQPPGERHEGGLFTIEGADRGRFVGDAAASKVATFRRLTVGEQAPCEPVPR